MQRKAIIIGASYINEGERYLSGVYNDTENFINYLLSSKGGGWHKSEIEVYAYSDSKTLRERLSNLEADYTVTLFAGHGRAKNNELDSMLFYLSPSDALELSDLFNKSKKQLLIIDTCRVIVEEDLSKGNNYTQEQYVEKNANSRSRSIYEKQIQDSDPGIVIITSCSTDQTASENEEGSYYLRSLIKAGTDYVSKTNQSILDIKQAFNQSLVNLLFYPTEQTPELTEGNISIRFPFAVNTNYIESNF